MNDSGRNRHDDNSEGFGEHIGRKAERKLKARREGKLKTIWFGLGMYGMVGWAVAIPTVLMTAIGIWLDVQTESGISWTITGIFVGVVLGSLNAWYWVKKESKHDRT
ncbi:MAG: ATP synthase subunit [candidate division Zixibacteria bacterium]|nr:ATP synthase subunit [candidate division Zixibacteria bacterium]